MRSRGRRAGAFGLAAVTATTVLAGVGASPASAAFPACTTSWATAVDGDWHDAERWSAGVPDGEDLACLDASGTYTVTAAADVSVTDALVGPGATLVLAGDIVVAAGSFQTGGTLRNEGTIDLGTHGDIGGGTYEQAPTGLLRIALDGTDGHGDSTFDSMARGGAVQLTATTTLPPRTRYALVGCLCDEYMFSPAWPQPAVVDGPADLATSLNAFGGLAAFTATEPARRATLGPYLELHPDGDDAETFEADVARIEAGTLTPGQLARDLSRSEAHVAGEVDALYRRILGRAPDAAGLAAWVRAVREDGRTLAYVTASLLGSREHGSTSPTTAHWVARAFQATLGRDPSPADRARFAADADRVGRGTVAHRLLQSPEGRRRRAAALFDRALSRPPQPADRSYWADRLLGQDDSAVLAALVGSAEARAQHQTRYRFHL